ncbi:MAG: FAD-dependent oxidoreductase [Eubacteriales bacterium]|nr:FAD-dependent oxidoreductase [Eubacteriales bacterium]
MMNTVKYCRLPGNGLPVISDVDIIVAGGTVSSIAAAAKAARMGSKVFVVGYLPYMGEDICGTYGYLFENQSGNHPLLRKMFPPCAGKTPTPFNVKKALEDELIDNNVNFLYSSYITDVLVNEQSEPEGIVIINRSGRQVILGKVIIDATAGAYVAGLAGADFVNNNTGEPQLFKFISVGNTSDPGLERKSLPASPKTSRNEYNAYEYSVRIPMKDWSFPSLCSAEQEIRSMVWDPDQADAADNLFYIPPFKIKGVLAGKGNLFDPKKISAEAFIPNNLKRFYVLGGCADIERTAVYDMQKPENAVASGEFIGEAAASMAKNAEKRSVQNMGIRSSQLLKYTGITEPKETNNIAGTVHTVSTPIRPILGNRTFCINDTLIPVIGEYDVAVVGGGTSGANAGISSARNGAGTVVVEYLHALGGTQTMGRVSPYFDGYRQGFTEEIDKGVSGMAPENHVSKKVIKEKRYTIEWKAEWYRTQLLKAGGEIWFGGLGCGAVTDKGAVRGILIATPQGLGVVLAHVVIDSTGSGDIAIAAGAGYEYTDAETLAVQGAGLPSVTLDDNWHNTDWTFTDDSDVFDITRLFVAGKAKFNDVYDIGKLPQTRERRRIVGDHTVSVTDVINHRRYPDTISFHTSSFDTHGYTVDPYFTILPPLKRHVIYDADVPLRSLTPKGLDNIIVTGLGASAHRDAMPVIRMQPCLQNQGYSVGYACALAVNSNCSIRDVDIKKVQAHLVEKGILPERVLTDKDNLPFSDKEFEKAVSELPREMNGLQVLLTDKVKAEKLLLEAFMLSDQDCDKVVYAQVLCMLGNGTGAQYVAESVRAYNEWDQGWDYTGMGQFGPCMSKLDSLIIALGESKQGSALTSVLEKAGILAPDSSFSHFRAIASACGAIGSSEAVSVLTDLLEMPSMTGHHVTTLKQARSEIVPAAIDVTIRNKVLREIFLACALYKCGDNDRHTGAQILKNYSNDLHGHYFRHTYGALNSRCR